MPPFQPTRPENRDERRGVKSNHGIQMAVVTNNVDKTYKGRLDVWIPAYGGDPVNPRNWITVQYANPFYGISSYSATRKITGAVTPGEFANNERDPFTAGQMDNAPKQGDVMTFGMWTQPPAVGTKVLVAFADGDLSNGFWFAAVPELAHGMIPAIGKGQSGQPEAEFDPGLPEAYASSDLRQVERPAHPIAATYAAQGLSEDQYRGYISTSSLRESPSNVMGFSTPSGHSFAMDDGDENGTSKLIRLRSAAGNQITMHDDTGMIYLINSTGNSWVELSPSGQIDVYGTTGINLASEGDINIHGNKNVSIHAGENLKLIGMKGTKIQGTSEMQITGAKTMVQGIDSLHIHSCNEIMITSFKNIFIKAFNFLVIQGKCFRWNSGTAKEAEQVPPEKPADVDGYKTTVARAPSREPYKSHDGAGGLAGMGGMAPGAGSGSPGGASLTGFAPTIRQDTAATSLGNNFSLGFNTGLAGNNPNPTINTSTTGTIDFNDDGTSNVVVTDVTEVTGGFGVQGFTSTDTTVITNIGTPSTTITTATGQTVTLPPPANPGAINAQSAAALGQLAGQSPLSSIPAAMGGGAAGFAKGNNCQRPADGGQPGGAGGAAAGQKNFSPPESLKNDPAFQAKLEEMKAKYPGLTDQEIYNIIGGESGFNWAATNPSGATGGFQFMPETAAELGYTTAEIQAMSPAQQLAVYDQYLGKWGYSGGSLGIIQAAPAFYGQPGNTVVYPVGSAAWNQNPGWRPPNGGNITIDSINSYYTR